MNSLVIAEIPSRIWNLIPYFKMPVDRSGLIVEEYLRQRNISWKFGDDPRADVRVYKEENLRNGLLSVQRLKNEYQKRIEKKPYINLNGEAQENSKIAYFLADPERTLSVAPGNRFKRMFYPSVWSDPQIETWDQRMDRICWIGRPLPERIRMVKKIVSMGIDIDIYSKEPWPFTNWRGYTEDEIATSQKYKYRIVVENSMKNRYHSEKLFNSIRSGCVTFYLSDPELILPHLEGAFIPYDEGYLQERADLSQGVMKDVGKVMYTNRWKVYSFRNFFDTILDLAHIWSNIV